MANKLGDRIKEARTRANYTQEELAGKLTIAYPTLNKYERGHRTPVADLLSRMAKLLNCDPGWLLTGEGHMHKGVAAFLGPEPGQHARISEDQAIYNVKDPELIEIIDILQKNLPEAKKIVLKLLKARKELKESVENLQNIDDDNEGK